MVGELLVCIVSMSCTNGAPRKRPNIIFILADDMGSWALGCSGNEEIQTPNIDKLASEGTLCRNFFCASPVCSPARASILTGRIPSQHGIHDWLRSGSLDRHDIPAELAAVMPEEKRAIEFLESQPSYTEYLKSHGYSCALSGKWHLGNSRVPQKGFSRWFAIARGGCSYQRPDVIVDGQVQILNQYVTDTITDAAVSFLDELSEQTEPFYLSVHYTAPHSPWERGEHQEEHLRLYDDCPFASVPDLPVHHTQVLTAPHGTGERRKELLRGYYAAVTAMDAGVGKLMERVEALGLRDDTLVVFTGDNGMNMGHHGVWGKGNATYPLNVYDTSVKVPAIFSQPGTVPQGLAVSHLLSQYDLFPTILDYASLPIPLQMQQAPGESFASLLKGDVAWSRQEIFIYDEYGPVRMIRTRKWKYVHRYPYGPHELFDLVNDPGEETNQINNPCFATVRERLLQRLGEWFAQHVDPKFDGLYCAVTGFGQVDMALPGKREGISFFDSSLDQKKDG